VRTGTLATIAAASRDLPQPAVVVIGDVVRFGLPVAARAVA
jgi:siroheme synthase